jgi:hypothetical protein
MHIRPIPVLLPLAATVVSNVTLLGLKAVQVGCKSAHFRSARDAGLVGEDDGVDSVAEMELSAIAALLWVRRGRGRLFAGPSADAREAGATGLHPL